MKRFNVIIPLVNVIAAAVLCGFFILHSFSNQRDKADRAVLYHVRYGLFSVKEWKKQLSVVLAGEINNLYLKRTTERELRKCLEVLLDILIDKVYLRIREANSKSAGGRVKQSLINKFINLNNIKRRHPGICGCHDARTDEAQDEETGQGAAE